MPEGPELHLASKYVNTSCQGRIFTGKVEKNPVHKSSDVDFEAPAYTIAAASRGKEMQLTLIKLPAADKKEVKTDDDDKKMKKFSVPESVKILFRFGMSGNFQFTTADDIHKHSHLRFFTTDKPPMVLSYVDIRRFGRWEVGADWSKERGPDPMFDYLAFRSNVGANLKKPAFNQPICEVMLNQKYFNGIGNYLRAEILYRLNIAPFEKARGVLEGLPEEPPDVKPVTKGGRGEGGGGGKSKGGAQPDILHLCHSVPLEVIAIGAGGYTADGKASDYSDFMQWLQCYYQDGMKNMVDHNGRTIWFEGPAGPMAPKEGKSRSPVKRKKKKGDGDATPVKVKKEQTLKKENGPGSKKAAKSKKKMAALTTDSDSRNPTPTRKKAPPKVASIKPAKTVVPGKKVSKTDEMSQSEGKSKSAGREKRVKENQVKEDPKKKPARTINSSQKRTSESDEKPLVRGRRNNTMGKEKKVSEIEAKIGVNGSVRRTSKRNLAKKT